MEDEPEVEEEEEDEVPVELDVPVVDEVVLEVSVLDDAVDVPEVEALAVWVAPVTVNGLEKLTLSALVSSTISKL